MYLISIISLNHVVKCEASQASVMGDKLTFTAAFTKYIAYIFCQSILCMSDDNIFQSSGSSSSQPFVYHGGIVFRQFPPLVTAFDLFNPVGADHFDNIVFLSHLWSPDRPFILPQSPLQDFLFFTPIFSERNEKSCVSLSSIINTIYKIFFLLKFYLQIIVLYSATIPNNYGTYALQCPIRLRYERFVKSLIVTNTSRVANKATETVVAVADEQFPQY